MTTLERRRLRRDYVHLRGMVGRCEQWVIAEALAATGGNKRLAAKLTGIAHSTFLRRLHGPTRAAGHRAAGG